MINIAALNTNALAGRAKSLAGSLWRLLTLSVGHETIWPARSICVCIEQGSLAIIRGMRVLSKITITGSEAHRVDAYPSPDFLASLVRPAREVTLVLPASWVITRTVELPKALEANLTQAVEFELDRLTPLKADDAFYDYSIIESDEEKITLLLSVCRADVVIPYIRALEEQRIRVGRVTSAQSALAAFSLFGKVLPDLSPIETGSVVDSLQAGGTNLLVKGKRTKTRPPLFLTILLLAAIAAAVVAYAVLPVTIEQKRMAEIDRQIKSLTPAIHQAEQLKKEIEAQEKENALIEGFTRNRIRSIDLLREITKVLPKTAWLTRARITDTTVDLEGYASSASEILPKLEISPLLRKVEFTSPTFRDTRLNTDRFVIRAEIENDKVKDGTKK